jgi:uncharacterized protein YodC (DUF2158 family)
MESEIPGTQNREVNSMSAQFKVGDKVQLNSGGPPMALKEFLPESSGGECVCQWFNGEVLKDGRFPSASLRGFKQEPSLADQVAALQDVAEAIRARRG